MSVVHYVSGHKFSLWIQVLEVKHWLRYHLQNNILRILRSNLFMCLWLNFKGPELAFIGCSWKLFWWCPDNAKEIFWSSFWSTKDFLIISLFSKPFCSRSAYGEVCWSTGIAGCFPLTSLTPSHECGECSSSWYYERTCLPLIKDLLQSANLIQPSAVLCSTLNASRNLTADRLPRISSSQGAVFYTSSGRCYSVQQLEFPRLIR